MNTDQRTAEDWGRVAVSLPGWRWMPRMYDGGPRQSVLAVGRAGAISAVFPTRPGIRRDRWPDPDDPATEGCLTRLLGPARAARQALHAKGCHDDAHRLHIAFMLGKDIGRACIAAAEALGRWPGGEG